MVYSWCTNVMKCKNNGVKNKGYEICFWRY